MKQGYSKFAVVMLMLWGGLLVYTSCSDMEKEFEPKQVKYPEITVTGFSPTEGRPGTPVTITGTNFGDHVEAAKISFNGVLVENITSYSDTEMIVTVPNDAGTGPLTVNVWTHTQVTPEEFNYIPGAKVSGIEPAAASPGEQVTISGESFGTDPGDVTVWFKDSVEAAIVSVTETELVVTVPDGGITGPVTLQVGAQVITGPVFSYPLVGLDFQFDTDGDNEGWVSTHNSTNEVSGGSINVTFDPAQFSTTKRRADFQFPGGVEVHAGGFPILAIKIDKPASGNFILDTNLGSYKNGSNNWEGILIGDVYYYDLRNTFGSAGNTLSTTEPTVFTTFQFKIADITTDETGYSVDWVRSFESLDALKEYIALPEGQYIFEFDDAAADDWRPAQNATFTTSGGKLKVTFDPVQFDGTNKRRADLYNIIGGVYPYPGGAAKAPWVYTPEYPIVAFKITFAGTGSYKPGAGNMKLDPYTGANNTYKTDFVAQNVIYYDMSDKYTTRTELTVFQLKIADITSTEETGYDVDWVRTFKSVDELNNFLQ